MTIATIDHWFDRLIHHHDEIDEVRKSIPKALAHYNPSACSKVILQMVL